MPARAVLLVGLSKVGLLARACAAAGVGGHVLPTGLDGRPGPCLVVPTDATDVSEAAQRLSRVLARVEVLALLQTDGQLSAQRWSRGRLVDTPPAGLLVQGMPELVTSLLVGGDDPAAVPGAVPVSSPIRRGDGPGDHGDSAVGRLARRVRALRGRRGEQTEDGAGPSPS